MGFADITATRCKTGALLFSKNPKYGYIDLGMDVLVIPQFHTSYGWETFINEVNDLYKKHTSTNQSNGIGLDIEILE